MKLSVIIPVYNERGNIIPLMQSIYASLAAYEYELILVDDGSSDDTAAVIGQYKNDRTTLIPLGKNTGQSTALRAGIEHSSYDTIVTMDGDMQNDPFDIPALVSLLDNGKYDLIQGYRKNRHDSITKKLPSALANLMIRLLFGLPAHDIGCSLKAFRRHVTSSFIYFDGFHRYIPLQAHMSGIPVGEMVVNHHHRHSGASHYGLGRTQKVIKHLWLFKRNKLNTLPAVRYTIRHEPRS